MMSYLANHISYTREDMMNMSWHEFSSLYKDTKEFEKNSIKNIFGGNNL